jgi:multidrug efflux pump subunit AcrB
MWIVRFALRYKYTVGVFAILILLFGVLGSRSMSTDILPHVDSPELTIVWGYGGLNAAEMASKITSSSENSILNNVDDVAEVRSLTTNGTALIKIRFQPTVDMATATAQTTAVAQTIVRTMPTGTTPPLIIRTSPSNVPIIQLVVASDTMSSGQLYDYVRTNLRSQLQSVPGMRISQPYGGASRQIMVDLDTEALNDFSITANEVSAAVSRQNLTLPSGTMREGARELPIEINASPEAVQGFLDMPIKTLADGRSILLRDVANVRDGEAVTSSIARLNGRSAIIISIMKLGNASTVDIIDAIRKRLPEIRAAAPAGVSVEPIFDQSLFVRAAAKGVEWEMLLVGCLVASVILLFLGSWRSTCIVLTSIPLALLCSVIGLYICDATFNLMTLGGLALAIGVLVDNALVEIENTRRHIAMGKEVHQAALDGALDVAFPEFVSTLSVCIVFLPIFLLEGTASAVFRPLGLTVVFAMASSYLLARTLIPTLITLVLPSEIRKQEANCGKMPGRLMHIHEKVDASLAVLIEANVRLLKGIFKHKSVIIVPLLGILALGAFSMYSDGREFFPRTDAGLIRFFIRAPSGLRVEETARITADVQREIRALIPAGELQFVVENVGNPGSGNRAWAETLAYGSSDAEIQIQLHGRHAPSAMYESKIRGLIAKKFPDLTIFFSPADATSQTLASGAQAAFEVRFIGRDAAGNLALAKELRERFSKVRGAVDVNLRDVLDLPSYVIRIDKARAASLGINLQDASTTLLAALGTGGTVAPNYWTDPALGTAYSVQVIAPPNTFNSSDDLLNLLVRPSSGGASVPMRAFSTIVEKRGPASVSRTTLQPTITLLANVSGRDLGGVSKDLGTILDDLRTKQKPGNRIELAGQTALMNTAFHDLAGGLLLAAILVFLVMVINFQSWSLPFVAVSGLPVAVSGSLFLLWVTQTPLSVPAMMGVIMVVGVSTANSVLVSSFARDRFEAGLCAEDAALDAARVRMRPVLMTATAMILGVIPMALGLSEGGEQNAPLGRAVIGGLLFGTCASLVLVPVVFAAVRKNAHKHINPLAHIKISTK